MLHPFDDHPIHQTPEPLLHPASGDRNAYDRFFFNGYGRDGSLYFAAAFGVYPNRGIRDASFSVVRDGRQHSLHASREAAPGAALQAGPIAIEIEEPMRTLRLRIAPNDWGLAGDLRFVARTPAVEEPRFVRREQGRLVMDATRFTQFGAWEGSLEVAGERLAVAPAAVLGTRDRSWGIRPIGERPPGPVTGAPQFFWLWAPLHFDDCCTHFDVNEDATGRRWHQFGAVVPLLAAGGDPTDAKDLALARTSRTGSRGRPARDEPRAPGSSWWRRTRRATRSPSTRSSTSRCSASATCIPSGGTACGRGPRRWPASPGPSPTARRWTRATCTSRPCAAPASGTARGSGCSSSS
jgi:hypothetical protein